MKKARCLLAWLLILALLCGCQTTVPQDTQSPDTDTTETSETQTPDHDWNLTGAWAVTMDGTSQVLTAPGVENAMVLHGTLGLDSGWEITTTVTAEEAAPIRILLCKSNGDVQLGAGICFSGKKAKLTVDQWDSGVWENLETGDNFSVDLAEPMELKVCHYDGVEDVRVTLTQNGEVLSSLRCKNVTLRALGMVKMTGVAADGKAAFTDFSAGTAVKPETPVDQLLKTMEPGDEGFYLALAEIAVEDMLSNFWEGDTETGRILPTSHGYATGTDYTCMWESAMLAFEVYDMWALTGDEYYRDLLTAQANYIQTTYDAERLEIASGDQNWACDDCAWNALLYLSLYTVTGDQWFVDRAIGLLDDVNERWYDEELNGIFYKDGVDFMSLYEVGVAWSWLQLWEITGEQRFYDLALRSYEGMHDRLGAGRDDGLYYCEANAHFHIGEQDGIHEAGSSSFLTGNMGMAALAAKFYRITGEQEYLDRVYKTNEGLLQYYDNGGVLLNDRDAWTNGTYTAFYASEVLSLPDTEQMQELLKNTALSIATNARTEDGYYGGSWSGPAEGSGSVWYNAGSVPQQSMTTGTSVMIITAAAILEAGIEHYTR